jgi:hypothetical protein
MEIKYYIHQENQQKGPFSISELKMENITRETLIWFEGQNDWKKAEEIIEIAEILSSIPPPLPKSSPEFSADLKDVKSKVVNPKKFKKLKFIGLVLLILIILYVCAIVVWNILRNTNSSTILDTSSTIEEVLPPPPDISYSVSSHKKILLDEIFKNCNLNSSKTKLIEACNYLNDDVRNKAVSIAGEDEGSFNLGQVCDIFDYCYSNWKYVNDPRQSEVYASASGTISNGLNGDCDDFAILVCSLILSIGGEARINFAYSEDTGHAFTEVNIGKALSLDYLMKRYKNDYAGTDIWTRTDAQGNKWLNLDWFAKHPGGEYFDFKNGTTYYIIQKYCEDFNR